MLAYAAGCALLGVESFAAIARQAPIEAASIVVLADAQQGKAYTQTFLRGEGGKVDAFAPLAIEAFADWYPSTSPVAWFTGPGLETFAERLRPEQPTVAREAWTSQAQSLLDLGWARFQAGERDDPFSLEPIYLRPSSAEELWNARR